MSSPMRLLAVAALALGAAAFLDLGIADRLVSRPFDVAYVPSGPAARVVALGNRTFLSDMYWLETVQYVGEPRSNERGWEKLYPLVDLVTDLDPRHGYAYQTAGIVLSAVMRLDESDRILDKGIEKGPPLWSFPYYRSFNAWFYRGDYEMGARYARIAAERPGASPNISQLAVALSAKSGTPEDAIAMLRELRAAVKDEVTASRLEDQMKLAILERDAQALERAAERFRAAQGRGVRTVGDLVQAGLVPAIPPDPFGGEYVWDTSERRVHSSVNPFRFSQREGPQSGGFVVPPREPRRAE